MLEDGSFIRINLVLPLSSSSERSDIIIYLLSVLYLMVPIVCNYWVPSPNLLRRIGHFPIFCERVLMMLFKFNSNEDMIQATLNKVGYFDMKPTEDNLRECFMDYVDYGIWSNIRYDDDDLDEFSINEICRNLWKLR